MTNVEDKSVAEDKLKSIIEKCWAEEVGRAIRWGLLPLEDKKRAIYEYLKNEGIDVSMVDEMKGASGNENETPQSEPKAIRQDI